MTGHWVPCTYALASTYRLTSVPQLIQAISPIAYSGEANYEGTLEVDDLCKLPFLCHLNNISICSMLKYVAKSSQS